MPYNLRLTENTSQHSLTIGGYSIDPLDPISNWSEVPSEDVTIQVWATLAWVHSKITWHQKTKGHKVGRCTAHT